MSESKSFFNTILYWAAKAQDVVLVFLMSFISILVFGQVVLRYVFKAPLMGIEELLLFPTTWAYLIGAIKASADKNQIVARVLEVFMRRQKSVYLVRAIAAALSGVVLIWLSYWGYDYLKYALRVQKESPTLFIPMIWSESLVFVSMACMTFYTIVEFFGHVRDFIRTPQDVLTQMEVEEEVY